MIKYDRYNITVLEQLKEYLSQHALLEGVVEAKDIYLIDIPEEYQKSDTLMKISYIILTAEDYSSGESKSDKVGVQIDLWKKGKGVPLGEGNRISDAMRKLGFYQQGSFDGGSVKDFGKLRDSRRYEKKFRV